MIDRDELLHVARLARLALHQDELDSTAAELSSILEHVAAIEELDRVAGVVQSVGNLVAVPTAEPLGPQEIAA